MQKIAINEFEIGLQAISKEFNFVYSTDPVLT